VGGTASTSTRKTPPSTSSSGRRESPSRAANRRQPSLRAEPSTAKDTAGWPRPPPPQADLPCGNHGRLHPGAEPLTAPQPSRVETPQSTSTSDNSRSTSPGQKPRHVVGRATLSALQTSSQRLLSPAKAAGHGRSTRRRPCSRLQCGKSCVSDARVPTLTSRPEKPPAAHDERPYGLARIVVAS
jgi:hypothetical protein